MGRYPFSFTQEIADHDCDVHLNLRPAAALRLMQYAATHHLDSLGLHYERLYDEGFVFMLSAVGLKFMRPIKAGERVLVATVPVAPKGVSLLRETVMFDEAGVLVAECQSAWVMVSHDTNTLLRPSVFSGRLPTLCEDYAPFCDVTRIRIPACAEFSGERRVRFSDLDRNRHMNNTVYADILCDAFAELLMDGATVSSLFIKFKAQARLGDSLSLYTMTEGDRHIINAKLFETLCFEGMMTLL